MPPKPQTGTFAALPVGGKILILVLGLGLLTGGYYFGFHMSLQDDLAGQQSRQRVLETKLREANQRQKEYLKLREELAARENVDKQYMRILPQESEIASFLDDINRLAELSGLTMGKVTPKAEKKEEFYVSVPVSISAITGKYHQLAKFFYNISRLERATNMENIKMSAGKGSGDGEFNLKVDVMATTFRRKDGA